MGLRCAPIIQVIQLVDKPLGRRRDGKLLVCGVDLIHAVAALYVVDCQGYDLIQSVGSPETGRSLNIG